MKVRNLVFLIAVLAMLVPYFVSAQEPTEEWVKRYVNGQAAAMALDSSGNVYVTGVSSSSGRPNYVTIKYDTNGNELWIKEYNSGLYAYSAALAIDSSGNVYVTGIQIFEGGAYGGGIQTIATVKYDSNGSLVWSKIFSGIGTGPCMNWYSPYATPKSIMIDGGGNVIVIGGTSVYLGYEALLAIKYDPTGNEIWSNTYRISVSAPYEGCSSTFAIAGTVDAFGNTYVIGHGGACPLGYCSTPILSDLVTVKFDTNGNVAWVSRYDFENKDESAADIAADSTGNIYVAGTSGDDYITVKYDTTGNQLWSARYSDTTDSSDRAVGLVVDPNGNVYVTGYSYAGWDYWTSDYVTVRYDAQGNQLWSRSFDGHGQSDTPKDIAIDSAANIYITGISITSTAGGGDYATIKYNADGTVKWTTRYSGPLWWLSDEPCCTKVDNSGNVYVTGRIVDENSTWNITTIKYSQPRTLTIIKAGTGTGAVTSSPAGIDCGVDCAEDYTSGTVVILTAIPVPDSIFEGWNEGGCSGTGPCTITMNADTMVTAAFTKKVIIVQIDIKPGSYPNSIKLQDTGNIPVAIFGSDAFDATKIDVSTLELNGAGVRIVRGKGYQVSYEDVNGDGLLDLVVHFDRGEVQLAVGDTSATVTGKTIDGTPIQGADSVRVVG